MKNRKGFTLIELLAIIVILAIIAVITVPIILGIVDEAKKGTAQNSAYGYKDAVNKFYTSKLIRNNDFSMQDKTYSVSELSSAGLSVSGNEPQGNSWVAIQNNDVVSGCLQFDDYKVDITDGNVGEAVKGECERQGLYIEVVTGDGITPGNEIVIKNNKTNLDEHFYIVNNNGEQAVLLAKYNLNVGKNLQDEQYGSENLQNQYCYGENSDTSTKQDGYWPCSVSYNNARTQVTNYIQILNNSGLTGATGDLPSSIYNTVFPDSILKNGSTYWTLFEASSGGSVYGHYVCYWDNTVSNKYYNDREIVAAVRPIVFVPSSLLQEYYQPISTLEKINQGYKTNGMTYLFSPIVVKYDPSTGQVCDAEQTINTPGVTTGCMRWYVYNVNDNYANMILDHNISTEDVYWNTSASTSTSYGPLNALSVLNNYTKDWNTIYPRFLTCASCQTYNYSDEYSGRYTINYQSYKARFISETEIIKIVNVGGIFQNNKQIYAPLWLNDSQQNYWTSSADSTYPVEVGSTTLSSYSPSAIVSNKNNMYQSGIRPVITVPRTVLGID